MTTINITGNYKNIFIDLENETLDASNNIVLKYNILNNTNGIHINCYFNLFLSTELLNKTVYIKLEHTDNDYVQLIENFEITSSSPIISKIFNMFTPYLVLTITSEQFIGNVYGNIKKINTTNTAEIITSLDNILSSSNSVKTSCDNIAYNLTLPLTTQDDKKTYIRDTVIISNITVNPGYYTYYDNSGQLYGKNTNIFYQDSSISSTAPFLIYNSSPSDITPKKLIGIIQPIRFGTESIREGFITLNLEGCNSIMLYSPLGSPIANNVYVQMHTSDYNL